MKENTADKQNPDAARNQKEPWCTYEGTLIKIYDFTLNLNFIIIMQPSSQVVYTHQQYPLNAYLNPVSSKIKRKAHKTSQIFSQPPSTRDRNLSSDDITQLRKKKYNPEQRANSFYHQSPILSKGIFKKKIKTDASMVSAQLTNNLAQEKSFLMDRNKRLENDNKIKDRKIQDLSKKFQQMQMRVLAYPSVLHDNSLITDFNCSTPRQLSNSQAFDHLNLERLKSIQQRLNKISFSKFFKLLRKDRRDQSI